MFGLFKKNKDSGLRMEDMDGQPVKPGDKVLSFRYELGECRVVSGEMGVEYESVKTHERVSWIKMIDASNNRQKVKKLN
jgi:hypothetical protein